MATTNSSTQQAIRDLQAKIPGLTTTYNNALAAWKAADAARENARSLSVACQARRDAVSASWKKNNACSLADRDRFLADWTRFEDETNSKKGIVDTAKKALDENNTQIDILIEQGKNALNLDPTFNLAQQQQNQNTQTEQKKTEEAEKTKRMIYIVIGLVGGLGAIVTLFAIFKPKKDKA